MNKDKPMKTAEELLAHCKESQGELSAVYWHSTVVTAMQEYANQQTSEMQKEIDELKEKIKIIDCLAAKAINSRTDLSIEYTTLKQSADEMAEALKNTYSNLEDIKENQAILETYKKLI